MKLWCSRFRNRVDLLETKDDPYLMNSISVPFAGALRGAMVFIWHYVLLLALCKTDDSAYASNKNSFICSLAADWDGLRR